jgi:hypothetical protein
MRTTLLSLLFALLSVTSAAAGELVVPLGKQGDLVLMLPDGWKAQVRSPRPDLPPTVLVTAEREQDMKMLVTPIWRADGAAPMPTKDDVRNWVVKSSEQAKTRSVEKTLPLKDFSAGPISGYYFTATDTAPEPDGYKFLAQGAGLLGDLRIPFTILMNGEPGANREAALGVIKSIRKRQ